MRATPTRPSLRPTNGLAGLKVGGTARLDDRVDNGPRIGLRCEALGDRPQRVAGLHYDTENMRAALGGGGGGTPERSSCMRRRQHEAQAERRGDETPPPIDGGAMAARHSGTRLTVNCCDLLRNHVFRNQTKRDDASRGGTRSAGSNAGRGLQCCNHGKPREELGAGRRIERGGGPLLEIQPSG